MKSRFLALDSFRGLAAVCIVFYHMHIVGSLTETSFFRGSFIFVDFFFVLSGFVLAHSYGNAQNLSFSLFIRKRFWRLYPLHFITCMGFISVELFRLLFEYTFAYQFNVAPFSGSLAVSEILPNLLLLQSWLPFADSFSFNAPSWSISVEFYLYILFFITVLGASKAKSLVWLAFAIAGFYISVAGVDVLSMEVMRGIRGFFGGAVMYLCYLGFSSVVQRRGESSAHPQLWKFIAISLLELACLTLVVALVDPVPDYQNPNILFVFLFTVLVFSFEAGALSTLLKRGVFQYLGSISYSVYLVHSLVLLFVSLSLIALQKSAINIDVTFVEQGVRYIDLGHVGLNHLVSLALLLLVLAVSHLTYKQIELRWQFKAEN